jgi:hypothetical protein
MVKRVVDVPRTIHCLSFETQLRLELGCKAYDCSMKALVTNIVAMYWDKKRGEIMEMVSEKAYLHVQAKLLKKFGGNIGELHG